jgi:hypothetical protein
MADKMPGRAAQTASSISGAIYLAPANPQARLSALRVIAGLLHATLAQVPVPCFGRSWTLWKHKEARPRPPHRLFETGAHAQRPHQPSFSPTRHQAPLSAGFK